MKHRVAGLQVIHPLSRTWIALVFIFLLFSCSIPLLAQEKGPTGLILEDQNGILGTTRAVVVGISDYQHPDIPDLRFAHRDAIIFVQYLQSTAGGSIPTDQIRLLTDSIATNARFESEITWLLEESQPGDQAIIYFSGHGDVEQKYGNTGFLLCHDASPKLYGSTGAFSVHNLKYLVQSFSKKGVRVILITDACRAGKLAGSPIEGPYLTAAAMKEQFANEIKLMACQPNEMSLESPGLGEGRGVFSYYLIRGLMGEGDEEGDQLVKLGELTRYLTYQVPKEVAPLYQNPQISGDAMLTLSVVDDSDEDYTLHQNGNDFKTLSYFTERGFEEAYLNRLDSLQEDLITTFNSLLKEKIFFHPVDHCADKYYESIQSSHSIPTDFKRYIKRKYAVALQDDIQQALLAIMDANLTSGPEVRIMIQTYQGYPRQIARSAEILGPRHLMYKNLKAREKWLEGFLLYGKHMHESNPDIGRNILNTFTHSLELEPNSPIVHYYMALTYINILNMPDSAVIQARMANEKANNWVLPITHIATLLSKKPYYNIGLADTLLHECYLIDSTNQMVLFGMALINYNKRNYSLSESFARKVLAKDSTVCLAWSLLAATMASPSRYHESEEVLRKAILKCPETANLKYVYGCILSNTARDLEAREQYKSCLEINHKYRPARDSLAQLYLRSGEIMKASQELDTLILLNPKNFSAHFQLALIAFDQRDIKKASQHLTAYFESRKSSYNPPAIDSRIDRLMTNPALASIASAYLEK